MVVFAITFNQFNFFAKLLVVVHVNADILEAINGISSAKTIIIFCLILVAHKPT